MSNEKVFFNFGFGKENNFDYSSHEFQSIQLTNNIAIDIKSDYLISFVIVSDKLIDESSISIFCEDFEYLNLSFRRNNDGIYTIPVAIYRDFLGYSDIIISFDDIKICLSLNIKMRKLSTEKFNSMISYLYNRSDSILRNLLSASKSYIGYENQGFDNDIEKILKSAADLIRIIKNNQLKLKNSHKTKLVPQKIESWKMRDKLNISPTDVMNNLDSVYAVYGSGDIFIKGRHFKIGDIVCDTLINSPNIMENKIILSGLYSVVSKLSEILKKISKDKSNYVPNTDQYISINETIIGQINQNALINNISNIVVQANDLIRFFEKKIGIVLKNEILYPTVTPLVRTSSLYRIIFEELTRWYSYGMPVINNEIINTFLSKIKSVPKLFEYFVLFKIHEILQNYSWFCQDDIINLLIYSDCCSINFTDDKSSILQLFYEPVIKPYSMSETKHLDLVDLDLAHRNENQQYKYYLPDFVFKYQLNNGSVFYIILDAKFSTLSTIRRYKVLDDLIKKYYLNIGVYDKNRNVITKNNIMSVVAVYTESMDERISAKCKEFGELFDGEKEPISFPICRDIPLDINNVESLDAFLSGILFKIGYIKDYSKL